MTTPASSPDLPDDGYVLGRTSEEYQRLRWRARLWEQVTAQVLGRVGIGPGMRCLDAGCGPGEVMRLMAGRVGASGCVTGLDNDGRLGREALEVLRATVGGSSSSPALTPRPPASRRAARSTWCRRGCCCCMWLTRLPRCASCTPGRGRAG